MGQIAQQPPTAATLREATSAIVARGTLEMGRLARTKTNVRRTTAATRPSSARTTSEVTRVCVSLDTRETTTVIVKVSADKNMLYFQHTIFIPFIM